MKDVIHEILSEVHAILAIASANDLRSAGKISGASPNIRAALEALAEEKDRTAGGNSGRASSERRNSERSPRSNSEPRAERVPASVDDLTRKLFSATRRLSKEEILNSSRSIGLLVPASSKDSRLRVVRKLAKALIGVPENVRDDFLSLFAPKPDAQTEGWIEVITKGK